MWITPRAMRSVHLAALLVVAAGSAAADPGPPGEPLAGHDARPAGWLGGVAAASADGRAIARMPVEATFCRPVAVLGPARSGRVRIRHSGTRLTIALWVDRDSVAALPPECRAGALEERGIREAYEVMLAARAIPPDTLVHGTSNGAPIGFARDWIPVTVHRTRSGWSEVTLGTELAARVWVRDSQIAHLR